MKNKKTIYLGISLVFLLISIFTSALVYLIDESVNESLFMVVISALGALVFVNLLTFLVAFYIVKRRREMIQKSFDTYVEESISIAGAGIIVYNEHFEIIWISKFIQQRLNMRLIGKNVESLSGVKEAIDSGTNPFIIEINGVVLRSRIDHKNNTIILKDITNERMLLKQYVSEKAVIGELEIDNYQQLQVILAQEELFQVHAALTQMFDFLVEKYNIVYRQYANGKYLIITNNNVLDQFIEDNFSFLDMIREHKVMESLRLSASMGFGFGSSTHNELVQLAKDGLRQSMSRGGDQVSVLENNKKPRYFGSKSEAAKVTSKVKIKQITELLEQRLEVSKVRNVIIYGHKNADLDAIGAALGMYAFVKKFQKDVFIQNETFDGTTTEAIEEMFTKEERQNIFIKPSRAAKLSNEHTLHIIVDTSELHMIESEVFIRKVDMRNIFILDHHRISKLAEAIPIENTYVDTSASSASEIVTELMQFSSKLIKLPVKPAQMLLNGIYLDTKQFNKSSSSRTFAAAAWLESFGASSIKAASILKLPERYTQVINQILSSVKEVKPGYFLSSYKGEVPVDIISLAADEILRTQGRKVAVVIAKVPGKQLFKMSTRGIDTNVQVIAEAVGGGGHFNSAAAVSKEPIDVFEDNVISAIVSLKGEE